MCLQYDFNMERYEQLHIFWISQHIHQGYHATGVLAYGIF